MSTCQRMARVIGRDVISQQHAIGCEWDTKSCKDRPLSRVACIVMMIYYIDKDWHTYAWPYHLKYLPNMCRMNAKNTCLIHLCIHIFGIIVLDIRRRLRYALSVYRFIMLARTSPIHYTSHPILESIHNIKCATDSTLTHHLCVIVGSYNGCSPIRRQSMKQHWRVVKWIPLKYSSEILIKVRQFSFPKMKYLKFSPIEGRQLCLVINVLIAAIYYMCHQSIGSVKAYMRWIMNNE